MGYTQEEIDRAFAEQKKRSDENTQHYVWKLLNLLEKLEKKSKSRKLEISFLREDLAGLVTHGSVKLENAETAYVTNKGKKCSN